ncbi:hypothetical protein SAMN05660860_01848 [Geoalkalibacter ferrihydriticus]|uniref:Uncharacterized protein n=2 Tax=Geoalkalibacter ferrihydriticus TaxID=392333 RepID=A0A0C2DVL6_9BACT|nr:integrase domain-containing protein [Geoalkalibacter ferrihydriticus]KIH77489.1 hypothetical protein GFER_01890 [Geoalkalibacter ferrihydriticus DSM 17813]SDM12464.1 hypothetical protein SAMN05660860_01848 [Geoalkalibacter ferrihydriticus]
MSKKSLAHQAKARIGKTHDLSHLTIEKNQGNLERLMGWIQEEYGLESIHNLKTKHMDGFFAEMRQVFSPTTLAGYAVVARDIAEAIGKENIVRSNKDLGASREGSRLCPKTADLEKMAEIQEILNEKAAWLGAAWQLQQAFGLRLSEAIKPLKIIEHKGQSCMEVHGKNGNIYFPPIDTPEREAALQRALEIKETQGGRGLIPADKSLKQGYDAYRNAIRVAGGTKENKANSHLGRHVVVQERLNGSVGSADEETRNQVVQEVGHYDQSKLRHYCDL